MVKFIFYIVIFYFVWRFLNSFFRPKSQTAPNHHQPQPPKQKVTVQYDKDKAKSKVGSDIGEYVEFEEIKEEK